MMLEIINDPTWPLVVAKVAYEQGDSDTLLSGITVSGADLRGVSLNGLPLSCITFNDCDMRGMDLRQLDFDVCDITESDLCGADLRGAHLDYTDFTLTDLRGCKFDDASVMAARFEDAVMDDGMQVVMIRRSTNQTRAFFDWGQLPVESEGS